MVALWAKLRYGIRRIRWLTMDANKGQREITYRWVALMAAFIVITVASSFAGAGMLSKGEGRYQAVAAGGAMAVWRLDTETGKLSLCAPRDTRSWPYVASCGPWGDAPMPEAVAALTPPSPPSVPPLEEPDMPLRPQAR